MADKKSPVYATPIMTFAFTYFRKPDDKAKEGAKFKPDGKFKTQGVIDSLSDLAELDAAVRAGAIAEFGKDVDFDEFHFPWAECDADHRTENFRGKVVLKASSKFAPKLIDSKRTPLPADMDIFSGSRGKLAVTLYFYEKTESVKVGKKIEQVLMRGCSLQLVAAQLIEKRGSGAGGGDYGDVFGDEDGYEADPADTALANSSADAGDGDF